MKVSFLPFLPKTLYNTWALTKPLVHSFNCWHQALTMSRCSRLTGGSLEGNGGIGIFFLSFTFLSSCAIFCGQEAEREWD